MLKENTGVVEDNIVGRLYNIIFTLKSINDNTEKSFCSALNLEEDDKASIYISYTELIKMCTLGISEIDQLQPKNAKKYKDTLNDVLLGLTKIRFNSFNGMDEFRRHFTSDLMISLEYCAYYLSENSQECIIEEVKIQNLIKEINEFIDNVMVSNVDVELEKVIIYQLNNVRESLLKYKYYGAQGIISNVSCTLGTLVLNYNKQETENGKKLLNDVYGLMSKINTLFSMKNNMRQIGEFINNFIDKL